MRNVRPFLLSLATLAACAYSTSASAQQAATQPSMAPARPATAPAASARIAVVSMKRCLEESKLGKSEKTNFEKMQSQMESVLMEKQKAVEEIESKLNDEDYLDSISDDAEKELKRKKRQIMQEGFELKRQYMETLQLANAKIAQKIIETISKASEQVAQDSRTGSQPIDMILNDEACAYFNKQLDVSDRVIAKMNTLFDTEQKDNANKK